MVLWLEGVWREEGECGVEWERVLAGRMLEREVKVRGGARPLADISRKTYFVERVLLPQECTLVHIYSILTFNQHSGLYYIVVCF